MFLQSVGQELGRDGFGRVDIGGGIQPPKEKTHSVRGICSVFRVNLHPPAAIPNKDWVKKKKSGPT